MKHTYQYSDKQKAILTVAERLFAEKGFEGASVRDIAHAADVNVAMISYYFGSKEKLMEAVFDNKGNNIRLKIENLIQDATIPHLDKVFVLIDDYVDRIVNQQQMHRIMLREQITESDTEISKLLLDMKLKNLESIGRLIEDGQKNGAFKKEIEVALMMTTLFGTVSNLLTSQQFYRKINNMEDVPENEFQEFLKTKLSTHIKRIFKSLLTDEK